MRLDDVLLSSDNWSVTVAPRHGGRAAQISLRGRDLLVSNDERNRDNDLLWGCYPMVPWCGRLRNGEFTHDNVSHTMVRNEGSHALHGFGFQREWTLTQMTEVSVTMSLDLSDIVPFNGTCEHTITVSHDEVVLSLAIASHGGTFPAMLGWHPWFPREWTYDVSFNSMLRRDADNIVSEFAMPPSAEPWDDCFFDAQHAPTLRRDELAVALESDCSFWMAFTEPTDAFCLEPMSGPPNSLDQSHPLRTVASPAHQIRRHLRFRAVAG